MTQKRYAVLFVSFLWFTSAPQADEPKECSPGLASWRQGQKALLEGRNEEAILCFRTSLEQEPALVQNHLSIAAAHLGLGENEQAANQLETYLRAKPEHSIVRGQYAELLLRLDRLDSARVQFERFASDIQEHEHLAAENLVNCHGRLLEIAMKSNDEYGMHLHRGIGLYWLACERGKIPDSGDDDLSTEGLLCQAASELVQARRQRHDEAKPCWYLHEVWMQLGQLQPAQRWLRAALDTASFGDLTPAEQRRLDLASRRQAGAGSRK
jgi:tetratricopeptide (TPR) repeat protein